MIETQNSASTTYDWLKNTLNRSLELLTEASTFWTTKRGLALGLLEEAEAEEHRDENHEAYLTELVSYNDNLETATLLVRQLLSAVEKNPFPGQQMSVLTFASKAFPNVRFRWNGKGAYSVGRGAWCLILGEYRFFCTCGQGWIGDYRVCFPVQVEWLDIEETERKLYELCRDDGTIAAVEVPVALGVGVNTKRYRTVKKELQNRDWVWKVRKVCGSKTEKVVLPPGYRVTVGNSECC